MRSLVPSPVLLGFLVAIGVGCAAGGGGDDTTNPVKDTGVDEASTADGGGDGTAGDSSGGDAVGDDTSMGDDTATGGDTAGDTAMSGDTDVGDSADSCPAPCGLGTKTCEGNAVRTCEASGACTAWSAAVACPGGTVCTAGTCATTCTDACTTLGAKECVGSTGVRECVTAASGCKDWSTPTACTGTLVCSGGACVASCTDKCTAGAKKCAGADSYQTCEVQPSGCLDWSVSALCSGGGSCTGSGTCIACTDGAKRCGATGNVETCATGKWTETASCAFGCASGTCSTKVTCTPGTYRCSGLSVEICNASGTAYLYTTTCAVSCTGGLCTGACSPGARRCNAGKVETCDAAGSTWTATETCTGTCDGATSTCVLPSLEIKTNTDKDGEIVVSGAVIVRSGATLNSPSGNLTIRAKSITVELGGSITAAPTTGADPALDGTTGGNSSCTAYGGNGGTAAGGPTDAIVGKGGRGGAGGTGYACSPTSPGGSGGYGGGVIRLIADDITVAGSVTANAQAGAPAPVNYTAGGGGGAGGGILLAGDKVVMSGTLSAAGGAGGPKYGTSSSSNAGYAGADGRVKILYGTSRTVTGSVTGAKTEGLLPPLSITSSTHPDSTLFYNDDFAQVAFAWDRPWASRFGYYHKLSTTLSDVPTPATGSFLDAEVVSYARSKFVAGNNWLHIVSLDPMSTVGTVENRFLVKVNATAPAMSSSSHASQTTWSTNNNPFFSWTVVNGDANYKGFHYVFDHYGDTVPTLSDPFLSITQKTKIQPGVADGVWAMHVVSEDTHGYLTKAAGHYVVRIGTDPGNGSILGTVTATADGKPISSAKVTINRGLIKATAPDQATNAVGAYNFSAVPAGSWELLVSAPGFSSKTVPALVKLSEATTVNVTLDP